MPKPYNLYFTKTGMFYLSFIWDGIQLTQTKIKSAENTPFQHQFPFKFIH